MSFISYKPSVMHWLPKTFPQRQTILAEQRKGGVLDLWNRRQYGLVDKAVVGNWGSNPTWGTVLFPWSVCFGWLLCREGLSLTSPNMDTAAV